MRILFDQGTPVAIKRFLTWHTVRTARQEGWAPSRMETFCELPRKRVLKLLLTTDNNLPYQQNLKGRKIAIVVLSRNCWLSVQRMIPRIIATVDGATPGSYALIEIPVR